VTQEIIQSNFAAVITVLMLFIFTLVDRSFNSRIRKLFVCACLFALSLTASEIVDFIMSTRSEPTIVRSITTALGYTLRMAIIYTVYLLTRRREQQLNLFIAMPMFIAAALSFISIKTGFCFSYNEKNEFVRGVLGYLPFYVCGFYMLLMLIWTYKEFRVNGYAETGIILLLCIIIGIATALETVLHYVFVLNGAIGAALVFYYLYLHVQIYMRDALTNLLNRRQFFLEAERGQYGTISVISIDMNNLKTINDTYGHAAGDKAICAVVENILFCMPSKCRLYRTGGDEFMMLCSRPRAQLDQMLENIRERMAVSPYTAAMGVETYIPGMDFNTVCAKADEKMYQNKAKIKEELRQHQIGK
jgi:diguanylate cyclase (GGDEF)-like protein